MPRIEVESDDVEALVQLAAVSRQMSQFVAVHAADPAVTRTLARVNAATDRLNIAVNGARRVDDPAASEPLSHYEIGQLRNIFNSTYSEELGGHQLDLTALRDMDGLRIKRCIQICNLIIRAEWKDGAKSATGEKMMVRLTERGQRELQAALGSPVIEA